MSATTKPDYSPAVRKIREIIQNELDKCSIHGLSLALVDGENVVMAEGFGFADVKNQKPATGNTVYRCGSISKLFNALAVMQCVERGILNLDAPVTEYDPQFHTNAAGGSEKPITLRQLLCHRSGVIREAPVGNFMDDSHPDIEETVHSIARSVLVNPPDTQTRYSNVAPTAAGHILELKTGITFKQYQVENIFKPLGMQDSWWYIDDVDRDKLAVGMMDVAQPDGSFTEIEAPVYDFGTVPAGNLFTTVEDLARFMKLIVNGGKVEGRQLIREETLQQMFVPQLGGSNNSFGIGFRLSTVNPGNYRAVSHGGAIFGFSSMFVAVPELRIGIILLISDDVVSGPMDRITQNAISAMLEVKTGKSSIAHPVPREVSSQETERCIGDYESRSYWAKVEMIDGELQVEVSGQRMQLAAVKPGHFIANSKRVFNHKVVFSRGDDASADTMTMLNQTFRRVNPQQVKPLPDAWKKYLGSYGHAIAPMIIKERHGHLYAMTENVYDYRLHPVTEAVFAMPPGIYTDEYLVFLQDGSESCPRIIMSGISMERRSF